MEKHIKKYIHIVSLLALGILFYALNANVPLRNDDLMYSFMYLRECVGNVPHPIDLNAPIDGIGDVFVSQFNHYFSMNGRTPVHFVVQLFCAVFNKDIFNICTSLVYILFLVGVAKLVFPDHRSYVHYVGIASVFWFFFPFSLFYASGISFAVNYMWSLTACIWFLLLYRKARSGLVMGKSGCALALAVSFLAGWSHEAFAMGIAGALFIHTLYDYKKNENGGQKFYLAVAFCLGAAMLVISPGTLGRLHSVGAVVDIVDAVYSRIGVLFFMKRLWLLLGLTFFLTVAGCLNIASFLKENTFLLMALCIEILFILLLGFVNERALLGVEFFSFLLLLRMLCKWKKAKYLLNKYILISFFSIFLCMELNVIKVLSLTEKEYFSIIDSYLADANGFAYQANLDIPFYYNRYISRLSPDSWEVKALSYYYGKPMHLFPASYKEYLLHIDSYLSPAYQVENGGGLYKIPETSLYIAQVDSCHEEDTFVCTFSYEPVPVKEKYSLRQVWDRSVYENKYDRYEIKVSPVRWNDRSVVIIDNAAFENRVLQNIVMKAD